MPDLSSHAEINALKARDYRAFNGIDLGFIKDSVTEIARHIGRDVIFSQYTRHDISHINQLLKSLNWIIPAKTADELTSGEWLMIVLSIYFHDLGMTVTQDEFNRRNQSNFPIYKEKLLDKAEPEFIDKINRLEDREKFLYQEFVRSKHAERIKYWIEGNPATHLGVATVVFEEIGKMLSNLDSEFRADLGIICESHHLNDLDDFKKYDVRRYYGTDTNEHVNLHYCALILRTADLLHITLDRTPSIEYRLINPSDPISQDEWVKQSAVKNVGPQLMRDGDGNVDKNIQSSTVEITAKFTGANGANGYFGLSSYLAYASTELKENYDWNQKSIKAEGVKYLFPWNKIDDSKIRTEGFVPKKFEFSLDQTKILQLLVGHTLYNDSTVVARELVQNSIDAIKLQAYLTHNGSPQKIEGEINIHWDSQTRVLSVMDNGTGMTQNIIEDHLLKVGSSRYQSEQFRKKHPDFVPISRFGIGILTCFLIADNVEIITSHPDEPNANKLTIRNLNGKYLLQYIDKAELNEQIRTHGTLINLTVRAGTDLDDLEEQLRKWIVFPVCPVWLTIDDSDKVAVGYKSPKEAVEKYLRANDYNLDGQTIRVAEDSIDGIELAYALKYDVFYKEWLLLSIEDDGIGRTDSERTGIGTCIEGIRIHFESPGFYHGHGIIAIANASGKHAPRTNVARSNIEADTGEDVYMSRVYLMYMTYIEKQLTSLQTKYFFSISWAAREVPYLLRPLVDSDYGMALPNVANKALFAEALKKANLLLVEQEEKRFMTSIDALQSFDDFWIVDSSRFRSAESLLRESEGASSLLQLIHTLGDTSESSTKHLNVLLCGFDSIGTMQKYALDKRSVSAIKIFPVERRVDVCWSKIGPGWVGLKNVSSAGSYYSGERSVRTYFIQNGEFIIDNLEDKNVIECYDMVFFTEGSPIWNYFSEIFREVDSFSEEDIDSIGFMLDFTHTMYSLDKDVSSYDPKQVNSMLNSSLERRTHEHNGADAIWRKFERAKLVEAITNTTWKIFAPSAWDR